MKVNVSKFDIEDFEDEIVLVNFNTGIYYSIKENGLIVFRQLINGMELNSIIDFLSKTYGENIANQFQTFTAQLAEEEILVQTETIHIPTKEIPRFNLNLDANFIFEKFDDISGLVKLDPIHEVSMKGWPNQKA